jgi:magnesium-transporting ATPase (P-type)
MAIRLRWPVVNTLAGATPGASPQEELQGESANEQLLLAARGSTDELLARLNTSPEGLSALQSELRLARVGPNQIAHEKPVSWAVQLFKTFRNPLVILLASLAAISLLTGDIKAAVIITSMILFRASRKIIPRTGLI